MADIDFQLVEKTVTVTKRTISDNNFRIMIDYQTKKLSISMPLKTHYSDNTVEVQRKELYLRDDDFDVAIELLFPAKEWAKPNADFNASVINLLKTYKAKLN